MFNLMAGSLGGLFPESRADGPAVVSVVLNNVCNLRCRHCYLQAPAYDRPLTGSEWLRVFDSLFGMLRPAVVVFAGKEIFADAESAQLLAEAIRIRDERQRLGSRTHVGVLTNGTLVDRYRGLLEARRPDHVDVSIDGLPAAHDHIRGGGAFSRVAGNLPWLVEMMEDRLWITHTVAAPNLHSLPSFVRFYAEDFGVRRFSVGGYQPLDYTDAMLAVDADAWPAFFEESLAGLARLDLSREVQVVMDVRPEFPSLFARLRADGWIGSDAELSLTTHAFPNGAIVRLHAARVPVGLWRAVRITHEGYWLAAEDLVDTTRYRERAVTRLRDCDFDTRAAYEMGLCRLGGRESMGAPRFATRWSRPGSAAEPIPAETV